MAWINFVMINIFTSFCENIEWLWIFVYIKLLFNKQVGKNIDLIR